MNSRFRKRQIFFATTLLICLSIPNAFSFTKEKKQREELVVIQTVSNERRTFVVARGVKDGVLKGQEILFSNENLSVVCKASEVSRDYSLWVPVDKNITVPFNKDDIISFSAHNYGNVSLEVISDVNNITPPINFNEEYRKFRQENNYSLKASYNKGITQSSSDVSTSKNAGRTGYAFLLEYNYRFLPEFEMSGGLRIDNDVYRIQNPELDIPTSRTMLTGTATYHFMTFTNDQNNYYLSLTAGIGKSSTVVNEEVSRGTVTLLPEVRLGYLMPFSKSTALIFEGSVESLSTTETFNDSTEQVTNILNFKATIGLRF